jgi:hypothetical protein
MAKKSAYELILQRVHQVVQAAGLFGEFENEQRFSLRVENEPWMDLVIESWPTPDPLQGEKRRVLVAHYARAGERELPDPELEMTDSGFPIRLRQTVFGIMETPILWRHVVTGQVLLNAGAKREIADLLRTWAKNIKEQGFAEAAARIVSSGRGSAGALGTEPSPARIEAPAQSRSRRGSSS